MRGLWSIALIVCAFTSPTRGASLPELSGVWKPLSPDDRLMAIKQDRDKITIEARDLLCTLTDVQPSTGDSNSIVSNGECFEESDTIQAKKTLTIVRFGRDLLLIEATVLVRHINENDDPKVDEAYTNKPAVVNIYRKVRNR